MLKITEITCSRFYFSAEDTVITAAHCLDGAFTVRMYLGVHNVFQDEESQVEVVCKIGDFAIHEEYDSETLKNDIAYIRFPIPITFSKHIFCFQSPKANAKSKNRNILFLN